MELDGICGSCFGYTSTNRQFGGGGGGGWFGGAQGDPFGPSPGLVVVVVTHLIFII